MKSKPIVLTHTNIAEIVSLANNKEKFLKLISKRLFNKKGLFDKISIEESSSTSSIIKHTLGNTVTNYHFKTRNNDIIVTVARNSMYYIFFLPLLFLIKQLSKQDENIDGDIIVPFIIFSILIGGMMYFVHKMNLNSIANRIENEFYTDFATEKNSFISPGNPEIPLSYFIHDGSQQEGPFSLLELKGKLNSKSHIWYEGIPAWKPAKDMPELKALITPTPPIFKLVAEGNSILPPESIHQSPPTFFKPN